jgi:formiminoglutamase
MKSNNNTKKINLLPFTKDSLSKIISVRKGEKKLGENIETYHNLKNAQYIFIGINEDIGPQANHGFPGASNGFKCFLSRFLNTQSNRFLNGNEICIYGTIDTTYNFENIEKSRLDIKEIDDFITNLLTGIESKEKTFILIGGGHNNAYPIIKSIFKKTNSKVDIVNLDPHADCRPLEGRHSGNPFSYANEEGFINNYTVLGLHEQFNSEQIYNYLDTNKFHYTFFEDCINNKVKLIEDISNVLRKRQKSVPIGFEIDLDSIAFMPSSAYTPSGFSIEDIRLYAQQIGREDNISYLHLPEAAPTNNLEEKIVGKTLTYIVLDFIKANKRKTE